MYGLALLSVMFLQLFTYMASYIVTHKVVQFLGNYNEKEELLRYGGYLSILYILNIGSTLALYFQHYESLNLLAGFIFALLIVLLILNSKELS